MTIREQAGNGYRREKDSVAVQEAASDSDQQRVTGVVLIHGLGPIMRNGMLQQALNALSYWFNHDAGLDMQPEGQGRIWLAPHLTDDPDPDQPASRAIVDVVAPGATQETKTDSTTSSDAKVRLEFREVWWADSLGQPNIGQTISWAQVQWREQVGRLLIPIRRRSFPNKTAEEAELATGRLPLSPQRRQALRSMLRLYDFYQYVWKVIQWLILTPAITVLLLVMGILQALAVVPFLGSTIVATSTTIINAVMLHWVAEIQVYLTDYTRSSAIRERFQTEVEGLLRDPLCDRVVVIAESGGTYIAYEGLTTLLVRPDLPMNDQGRPKPVTFICIASALHRIWLLANTDSHRMHGVLPSYVRWLHFWAAYDPVAAGPLTDKSIPRITKRVRPEPDPYEQIRASLRRCENFAVVNTDSTFTDHVSYWDNLEEVVGPIACELAAGHPVLERTLRGKLASASEVLLRSWDVAWRYTLALAGGIAAGLAALIWAANHPEFRRGLTALLNHVPWMGIVDSVCSPCTAIIGSSAPNLSGNPTVQQLGQYAGEQAATYLFRHYALVQSAIIVLLALLVMGLTETLIARLAAPPTPFFFPNLDVAVRQRLGSLFAISAVAIGLIFLGSVFFSVGAPQGFQYLAVAAALPITGWVWGEGLGEIVYAVSVVATLVAIIQQRRWGWAVGLALAFIPLTTFDPFYRSTVLAVAVVGCVVCLFRPFQSGGVAAKVLLPLVAGMCVYASIGTTLYDFGVLHTPLLGAGTYIDFLFLPLIYALRSGMAKSAGGLAHWDARSRIVLVVAVAYLGLVCLLTAPYIVGSKPEPHLPRPGLPYDHLYRISPLVDILGAGSSPPDILRAVGVLLALMIGGVMLLMCMVDARNEHRWGWLAAIPLVFVGLTTWLVILAQLGIESTLPEGGLLLSYTLVATTLIYALWAGPARWRERRKSVNLRPASDPA